MSYVYEELTANGIACRLMADKDAGWTYPGALALAEHLIAFAEDTGEPIALDTIALRCDYAEYSSLQELQDNYGAEKYPNIEAFEDATTVIKFDSGYIIAVF